jgi:hypothetical protein
LRVRSAGARTNSPCNRNISGKPLARSGACAWSRLHIGSAQDTIGADVHGAGANRRLDRAHGLRRAGEEFRKASAELIEASAV